LQRQAIHKYAEDNGLESESWGPKQRRVLTLRIPNRRKDDQAGMTHDLRIMKSGNEEENRRMMRHETKYKRNIASAETHIIQVQDTATLKSLQLVFKSLEDASMGPGTRQSHGHLLEDGTVELDGSVHLLPELNHDSIFNLFESSPPQIEDGDRLVVIMRGAFLPSSPHPNNKNNHRLRLTWLRQEHCGEEIEGKP